MVILMQIKDLIIYIRIISITEIDRVIITQLALTFKVKQLKCKGSAISLVLLNEISMVGPDRSSRKSTLALEGEDNKNI